MAVKDLFHKKKQIDSIRGVKEKHQGPHKDGAGDRDGSLRG